MKILLVEDEKLFRAGIRGSLPKVCKITEADNALDAITLIRSNKFDVALIDLDLERRGAGYAVVEEAVRSGAFSVVLSSHEGDEDIEKAYQLGSHSYFVKDADVEKVTRILDEYEEWLQGLDNSNASKKESFFENQFITEDQELRDKISILFDATNSDMPIFLTGPTGVGKTTLATKAHELSKRKSGPLINMSCANISIDLLESELFGHVKGAFTGADKDKKGKLALADGGTLFLDEVATLPMNLQEKLLKAIEEKKFYPVGGERPVKSDFRIISATSSDMGKLLSTGKFKPDLYFRLSGIDIFIKPIKDRKKDIWLHIKKAMEGKKRVTFSREAKQALLDYDWPGNTREIYSQVLRLIHASKSNGSRVQLEHLPNHIIENKSLITNGNKEFLTDEQLQLIERIGLKQFLSEVQMKAVERLNKKYKPMQVIEILGVSNKLYYSIKDKLDGSSLQRG